MHALKYSISPEEIKEHNNNGPYEYSAIIDFEGDHSDPTILHVVGNGMSP